MGYQRRYGVLLSILLHMMILMIPVSGLMKKNFNEVELIVKVENNVFTKESKSIVKEERYKSHDVSGINLRDMEAKSMVVERKDEKEVVERKDELETQVKEFKTLEEIESAIIDKIEGSSKVSSLYSGDKTVANVADEALTQVYDVEYGTDSSPAFTEMVRPIYPTIARKLGKEGKVVLRLTIDQQGDLINVEVLEGAGYGFTEAAIEAVRKSRFRPAIIKGKAVISRVILPIRFSLRRGDD